MSDTFCHFTTKKVMVFYNKKVIVTHVFLYHRQYLLRLLVVRIHDESSHAVPNEWLQVGILRGVVQ